MPKVSIPPIQYFLKWVSIRLTFSSDTNTITWFIKCRFSKAGESVSARRSNINTNMLLFLNRNITYVYAEKLHLNLNFVVCIIRCTYLIWLYHVIVLSYSTNNLLRVLSIILNYKIGIAHHYLEFRTTQKFTFYSKAKGSLCFKQPRAKIVNWMYRQNLSSWHIASASDLTYIVILITINCGFQFSA